MRNVTVLAVVVLAALAAGLARPGGFMPSNGRLVFSRLETPDAARLWTIDADGRGAKALSRLVPGIEDQDAAWSPGGGQIAFSRWDTANCGIPCADIYVVRADGIAARRLANLGTGQSYDPSWSPDGTRLAALSQTTAGANDLVSLLFVKELRTSKVRQLVPGDDTFSVGGPAWSPDGRWLCFDSTNNVAATLAQSHLYLVRPDGSRRHELTPETGEGCSWSPDGTTIAFAGGGDIRTIRADGAGLTRLTRTAAVEHDPAWSPDGSTIAFLRQARGGRSAPFDLWTMAADGSAQTRVASDVSSFVWSPDGTMVAFIKGSRGFVSRKKRDGLWVAQADGSGQVELARGADQVDWQRLP